MQLTNLASLYQYFDDMAASDADSDTLFASSYIRGFISLAASIYGDEQQTLSARLAQDVSEQLHQARTELAPQDRQLVNNFWLELQAHFAA
ncbi:YfcL family protein [Thalassomonas viridans]|uniref:YfcL family protein n=1 Tax=Thalassomonas viridans TaxID=137584 RepID=A0AAF0C7D6_9GAMM|nr:YfcL family protein [Thalassomonas viridans]WDE03583.1 YfcL family protein [Thalassomonas viridans]